MEKRKTIIGVCAAIFTEFIYGSSYMFTKQMTETASNFAILSWRFMIAFIILTILIIIGVIKVNFKGKNMKALAGTVLFSPVLYFIFETLGISLTTSSECGTIVACIPIATIICSSLIIKEKPTQNQVAGITLTLIGAVLVVITQGMSVSFSFLGYFALFAAVFSYGVFAVLVQRNSDFSDIELTYAMVTSAMILFTMIAIIENASAGTIDSLIALPFYDSDFLIGVLYLGIGSSIIAFFLSNVALSNIGANRTCTFVGLSTVISVVLGPLFLNEKLTLWQIVGILLILGGVYTANAIEMKKKG